MTTQSTHEDLLLLVIDLVSLLLVARAPYPVCLSGKIQEFGAKKQYGESLCVVPKLRVVIAAKAAWQLALVVLSAVAILLTMLQFSELAVLTKSARESTNDAPISQQQQQQQVNNATKNHKQEKNLNQMHHASRNNTQPAAPSSKNDARFEEGSVGNERNNKKRNNRDTQHLYMKLSLSSNATTNLGIVEPQYISTTMDWWGLGTESWDNSSILNANLQNPNLKALAKGLGPCFLRIGGSQADQILYYMNKHNDSSSNKYNIHKYPRNEEEALANECQRDPQKCLTSNRWDAILDFAHKSNMHIVFTLAYIRHTRNENGTNWESTNARSFLEYTASSNYAHLIYGFELGNELRHKGKMTNVTRMVLAYRELRELVNDVWKAKTNNTMGDGPKILGPASTGGGETSELVSNLWPYIDIVTYHKYHGGGKDQNMIKYSQQPSFHVHPMMLVGPGFAVEQHLPFSTTNGVKTSFNHTNSSAIHSRHFHNYSRLWIGEGAMVYNSGLKGVSDSFGGSLWFANLLSALAKTRPLSHGVYCRQSLLGGHYELIDHISLLPNPDYWVAYVWKNLVGRRSIGPILSPGRKDSIELSSKLTFGCCKKPGMDTILIHSFCAKKKYNRHHDNNDTNDVNGGGGDVIFIIINISEVQGINLNFTLNYNSRTEYILQPSSKKDGMHARAVKLNGIPMLINKIDDNTVDLPKLHNHLISRTRDESAYIHPISIAFIVLHSTDVTVCQ